MLPLPRGPSAFQDPHSLRWQAHYAGTVFQDVQELTHPGRAFPVTLWQGFQQRPFGKRVFNRDTQVREPFLRLWNRSHETLRASRVNRCRFYYCHATGLHSYKLIAATKGLLKCQIFHLKGNIAVTLKTQNSSVENHHL